MSELVVTPASRNNAPLAQAGPSTAQYLTFQLGREVFGLGILCIKEIIEYPVITQVPMTPEYIRGVINLRGAVVPVLDLQTRFGRPASNVTKRSCIVIVEVEDGTQENRQIVGLIVDAVNEVLDIAASDIERPPEFGAHVQREFIQGMGKVDNRFIILLDANKVLNADELGAMASVGATVPAH